MSHALLQLLITQAWQIAALAIAVLIVTRTVAKNRPHLAHALWMLVLIKCVTPPIWGHSLGLFSQLQALWKADPVVQQELVGDELPLMPQDDMVDEIDLVPPADDPKQSELITSNEAEIASTSIVPLTLPGKSADSSIVPKATPWKPSWPTILLSLIGIGAVLTISNMVVRCVLCLRHIQRHRTTEFDEFLNEQLQRLSRKLRLRRVPRIIVSDLLFGPAVIGLWKHVIVLPRCLLKTESGERKADDLSALSDRLSAFNVPLSFLDPILAHELLHIRRGDLRTGKLQAVVQSLWWFHPAVWLCNRWLSREAERCCDEQVIAELECSPAQYAHSLLSVIESKHALQPIPVFPGMKPVEITSQRMERIMSLKSNLKKQSPLWCWLAAAGLAIVVLPGAIAQPQSDENVVEAQPQERGEPQETKVADVAEVQVCTKTYLVGDLIERLAREQNLPLDQARKSLLQIFESSIVPVLSHVQGVPAPPVNLPQPSLPADASSRVVSTARTVSSPSKEIVVLSSCIIEGDHMVVVQSAAGHATLQEYVDAVRQYGFTTFLVTTRYIMGPPEVINSVMEALQQEKPFPQKAEGEAVPKSSGSEKQSPQAAATLCVGTTGIVSREEARKIEELARSKADCLSIQCPKVRAINSQLATIRVGEIKPFIVGFKENDEPMIRTVVEGLTLRVTPKVLDKGLFQVKSVACLEGTSEQRLFSTTGRVTETPKMFTLPAITTKQVQTTVELHENQAFLQSGIITTEDGKSQAFLTVLEAQLFAPEVAAKTPALHPAKGPLSSVPKQNENVATLQKSPTPMILITYCVGDLAIPVSSGDKKPDFASIGELIKATIEPDSWRDEAAIGVDRDTFALVIRQTPQIHERIAAFLHEIREDTPMIEVSCRLMKLTTDEQFKGLEERCSLNIMNDHKRWALLTKEHTEGLAKFLTDEKCHVLLCPGITTLSGMMATIQVDPQESVEAEGDRSARSLGFGQGNTTTLLRGCAIGVEPQIIGDSSVIRLKHSVYLNLNPQPENDSGPLTGNEGTLPLSLDESLVSSGQTLLLLIDTTKVNIEDAALDSMSSRHDLRGRYVLMLTVARLEEEEAMVP